MVSLVPCHPTAVDAMDDFSASTEPVLIPRRVGRHDDAVSPRLGDIASVHFQPDRPRKYRRWLCLDYRPRRYHAVINDEVGESGKEIGAKVR